MWGGWGWSKPTKKLLSRFQCLYHVYLCIVPPPTPAHRLYACSLDHPSLSSLDTYSMVSRGVYYACIFSCIYLLGWCISCRVNDVVYNWLNIMPLMTKSLFLKCTRLSNSRNKLKTVLEKEQEITFDFHLVIKSCFFFNFYCFFVPHYLANL